MVSHLILVILILVLQLLYLSLLRASFSLACELLSNVIQWGFT